jgi:riboflavin biosynthesis pyrimidine reductase
VIDDRIRALFGEDAVLAARRGGVVHVTAVWGRPDEPPAVLKIQSDTPKSPTDRFALCVTRASVDAIVATGRILRAEPTVTFGLDGDEALARWRRDALSKSTPPLVAILTSGRDVDFAHPAFHSGAEVLVYSRTALPTPPPNVKVVTDESASVRRLVHHLKRAGRGSIAIEAGPSTALELYAAPLGVDALYLSVVEGEVPATVVGGRFLGEEALTARFARRSPWIAREEFGRRWRFCRYFNA